MQKVTVPFKDNNDNFVVTIYPKEIDLSGHMAVTMDKEGLIKVKELLKHLQTVWTDQQVGNVLQSDTLPVLAMDSSLEIGTGDHRLTLERDDQRIAIYGNLNCKESEKNTVFKQLYENVVSIASLLENDKNLPLKVVQTGTVDQVSNPFA